MITITPFRAVRPPRDKANLVSSRPFYNYKKNILSAKLEGNTYTFLHVINPEFKEKEKTAPNSKARFLKVREKYEEFKSKAYLVQDEKPSFYIYKQQTPTHYYIGIIAGTSVEDYKKGTIKIHEHTLTEREKVFCDYIDVCKFNAEPVLLTYKDHPKINEIIKEKTQQRPEYEFSTTDMIKHELWVVDNENDVELITETFKSVPEAYIADGHHRSASSALYAAQNAKLPNAQVFLSYFIAESSLKIYDFNRTVKGLNGLSPTEFLEKTAKFFIISEPKEKKIKPKKLHDFSMFLDGKWYLLTVKKEYIDTTSPVGVLDPQILSDTVLSEVLGIKDLKSDKRVSFIEGTKGSKALKKAVESGKADVAFRLFPISIEQLKLIADTNNVMPPKSTWIEPKLRSGLTIYEF